MNAARLKVCQEHYDALAEDDPDEIEERAARQEAETERQIEDREWK